MNFSKRLQQAGLIGLSTILFSACSSYYMVRDPSTGNTYYTHEVGDAGRAGAVRFKDESSDSVVTLPTSEVTKISGDEYHRAMKGR